MKIQDLLVLALQILGPCHQKRMSSRLVPFDPQKLSLEVDPLSKWGVRLQNSSTYSIHYTAQKRGVRLQNSSTKGGSPSKFHQPLEFINIQPPKGGTPLEFINIQPQNGGLPLEFINIKLKMGVRLQGISMVSLLGSTPL